MIERCVRTHCPDLQAMSGRPQWRAGAAGESRPKELPKGAFSSWPHHNASRRGEIARPVSSRRARQPAFKGLQEDKAPWEVRREGPKS